MLLDTHLVLWMLADDNRIGPSTRARLAAASEVLVSAVSIWEAAIKSLRGRLVVPDDLVERLQRDGMTLVPITPEDAMAIRDVTGLRHADPFDRLLVTQAQVLGVPLVTADRALLTAEIRPDIEVLNARL